MTDESQSIGQNLLEDTDEAQETPAVNEKDVIPTTQEIRSEYLKELSL